MAVNRFPLQSVWRFTIVHQRPSRGCEGDWGTAQAGAPDLTCLLKRISTSGNIAITHGPLLNLGMPAMTVTFVVQDRALLKGVKTGDRVRFRAE
jgi:Cu/Ag efflux protein CusF